jgi:hypothetical protein
MFYGVPVWIIPGLLRAISAEALGTRLEEILVPLVAEFAQATIKPYYLEREIFVKRCNRICFGVRQI